jgi:hypothetical protein
MTNLNYEVRSKGASNDPNVDIAESMSQAK